MWPKLVPGSNQKLDLRNVSSPHDQPTGFGEFGQLHLRGICVLFMAQTHVLNHSPPLLRSLSRALSLSLTLSLSLCLSDLLNHRPTSRKDLLYTHLGGACPLGKWCPPPRLQQLLQLCLLSLQRLSLPGSLLGLQAGLQAQWAARWAEAPVEVLAGVLGGQQVVVLGLPGEEH